MRESAFVKRNKSRWEEFETVVKNQQNAPPDKLAELFIQITDDLSFSRTQYPNSRTTQYLNSLASKIHGEIYKNKKEDKNRFILFWKEELPAVMFTVQKQLFYAFVIFIIAGTIGAVSAAYDDTFVRLVLGDSYVNMTLENIKNGNPTKVYSSSSEIEMFFLITRNNILVSFMIFIYGVFASLGTGLYLFYNALMVGTFIMFFYNENQLAQGLPVILLHGTIELTSIVIAAAAGFVMGNSILFPGTYKRSVSFARGGKDGLKLVTGLIPLFITAAFLESFVTRYTEMPLVLSIVILAGSLGFIVWYFFLYPNLLHKRMQGKNQLNHISASSNFSAWLNQKFNSGK